MRAYMNFSVAIILMCVYVAKADITEASLDAVNVCDGSPFEIKEGNELRLVSKGMVQKGMCSVRVNVQRSQNCRGVCFNLRSSNFGDCSAKLITTAIHFEELVPDVIKEKSCKESMEVPWCSSAHTLKLDLVVDDMVTTPKYNISASVYPKCGDDVYEAPSIDLEERSSVILGFCVYSVFVIMSLATCYCYKKNFKGRRTVSPSVSKEKTLKNPGEGEKQSSSADQKDIYLTINGMEKEEANLLIAAGEKS